MDFWLQHSPIKSLNVYVTATMLPANVSGDDKNWQQLRPERNELPGEVDNTQKNSPMSKEL